MSNNSPPLLNVAFKHHAPKGNQTERYSAIRAKGLQFAALIQSACPEGVDRDEAIKLVRQAVMNANAAIAVGEANATGTRSFDPDIYDLEH